MKPQGLTQIEFDFAWVQCARIASFDLDTVAEVLGSYEGSADGRGNDWEWWMLVKLQDGSFGVLWGDDGATCSHCGAFISGHADAEFRSYDTETEARASIPIDVELT